MRGEQSICNGCGYPTHTGEHGPDCPTRTNVSSGVESQESDSFKATKAELAKHERSTLLALVEEDQGIEQTIMDSFDGGQIRGLVESFFMERASGEEDEAEVRSLLAGQDIHALKELIGGYPELKQGIVESLSDGEIIEGIARYFDQDKTVAHSPEAGEQAVREVDMDRVAEVEERANLSEEQRAMVRSMERDFSLPLKFLTEHGIDFAVSALDKRWKEERKIDASFVEGVIRSLSNALADYSEQEQPKNIYGQLDKSAPDYEEGIRDKWVHGISELLNGIMPGANIELNIPERGTPFDYRNQVAMHGIDGGPLGVASRDVVSTARLGITSNNKLIERPQVIVAQ